MKKFIQRGLFTAMCFGVAGASQAAHIGSLTTEHGSYEITAKVCAMYVEDGAHDIEIYGPGKTPENEKMYFEFSSTGQSIDISIGVDSGFSSSDNRIQSSGEFKLTVDGDHVQITNIQLVDQNRQVVSQDATFEIDCSARHGA